MSGYMSPDDCSVNAPRSAVMNYATSPTQPILKSSNDSNYSSIERHGSSDQPEKDANLATPTVNIRGPTYSYEELSNGLTCPTCKGTGKIPRGQEDDLVALIPYNDERLKPHRTWLYVCLSFSLCIIIAGVLCAFLIPRSIDVVQDNVTTLHVNLNASRCILLLKATYNVTNNNFLSVTANDFEIEVTVLFHKQMVLHRKFTLDKKIGIRVTEQMNETFNVTMTHEDFPIEYCKSSAIHDSFVYMQFESTFNFTLMSQTDTLFVSKYIRVNCNPEAALDPSESPIVQSVGHAEFLEAYDKHQSLRTYD